MNSVVRAFFWRTPQGPDRLSPRNRGVRHGFTLIELLVVVAIISILAAIAIPNFLEAQTRAKVARIMNDQRTLATALEAYSVDNNKYPPRQVVPNVRDRNGRLIFAGLGDVNTRLEDLSRLTTPIAYVTAIPLDIFEKTVAPPNNVLDFWTDAVFEGLESSRQPVWGLVSVGPDGGMGQPGTIGNLPPAGELRGSMYHDYDPTNGTVSPGNVYRFAEQYSAVQVFFE